MSAEPEHGEMGDWRVMELGAGNQGNQGSQHGFGGGTCRRLALAE